MSSFLVYEFVFEHCITRTGVCINEFNIIFLHPLANICFSNFLCMPYYLSYMPCTHLFPKCKSSAMILMLDIQQIFQHNSRSLLYDSIFHSSLPVNIRNPYALIHCLPNFIITFLICLSHN